MNKDELRIRIIPEDGQVLIETHTDGIVKCKEIQEDALLDCIKNSMRHNYISSGLLPPNCLYIEIDSDGNKSYCLWYPRLYADISYHETAYPSCQDWSLRSTSIRKARSENAGWALSQTKSRRWRL